MKREMRANFPFFCVDLLGGQECTSSKCVKTLKCFSLLRIATKATRMNSNNSTQPSLSTNSNSTLPQFGKVQFTPEEKLKIQQLLQEKVGPEVVSFRPGPNESIRIFFRMIWTSILVEIFIVCLLFFNMHTLSFSRYGFFRASGVYCL